jgi:uncharacterized membrane protein
MDEKIEKPQGTDRYDPHSGMTIEDIIRSIKESAEEMEKFVLKIRKTIGCGSDHRW